MGYIEIFGIAVTLALDAFAVSTATGMCKKKFKIPTALKMALCFGVFQFVMPLLGYFLGKTFADYINTVDHFIGFALLLFIGGKMIVDSIKDLRNKEEEACSMVAETMSVLLIQGVATSIDAFAAGVPFAFTEMDMSVWIAAGIIGFVAFALSFTGAYLGKFLGSTFGKWASIFGGSILIGIGIKMLVEGLLEK